MAEGVTCTGRLEEDLKFLPKVSRPAWITGTELTSFDQDGQGLRDPQWDAILERSGYSQRRIEAVVHALGLARISLLRQPQSEQAPFKSCFYYRSIDAHRDAQAAQAIREEATRAGLAVNMSRCNPFVGDPADCFDVDFIPAGTGKRCVVEFLLAKTGLPRERTLAFGESGNDLDMLKAVGQGYLVANATEEAKALHDRRTAGNHAGGILEVLRGLV